MFGRLGNALDVLREALAGLDHSRLSGEAAVDVVRMCTEAERMLAATRTLAARRVVESKVWQHDGHRTAAHWMAAETGTFVGQAIGVLETARRLEELPLTRDAFCSGRLSEVQAREISDAAAADPRKERALLESAQKQSVKALREECRRVRVAAVDDDAAGNEAIRLRRYLRTWSDHDGAVRLDARLTPADGAEVIAAIESAKDRILAHARRAGRREPSEAYAADALVELISPGGADSVRGPRGMVHVLVDHAVLTSGVATADQTCEIPGIGRIPAATARALVEDSILKVIVTKGADIHAVANAGRTIPARVRTALEIRDPACVVPECDQTRRLEIDHINPFADGGPTKLANLARLCRWHHYQKTHLGHRLSGGPGHWIWETPSDLEGSAARPPPDS